MLPSFKQAPPPKKDRALLEAIYRVQQQNARYTNIWLWLYIIFIVAPITLAIIGAFLLSQKFSEFRERTNLPGIDAIVTSFEDFATIWKESTKSGVSPWSTMSGGISVPDFRAELQAIQQRLDNIEARLGKK